MPGGTPLRRLAHQQAADGDRVSAAAARAPARGKGRRSAAGIVLFATLVATVAAVLLPTLSLRPAGVLAWLAGALLWPEVARNTRLQSILLAVIGATGIVWGLYRGIAPDWTRVLSANAVIIALLAGVSFLRLITRIKEEGGPERPGGRRSILATLAGLHLFGAVVNLSTLFVMAHAMARDGRLDSRQVRLLTRGYSAAAFWSPFFAGMAVALTYAPGARLGAVLSLGIPLAMVALALIFLEIAREDPGHFRGYPMDFSSLGLPAGLAVLIVVIHEIRPDLSVVAVMAGLAPSVAIGVMAIRRARPLRTVADHVTLALPRMANELTLFLAAGVLAAGIASALAAGGGLAPFDHFGALQASLTLALLILAAVAGVHPVISIAAASAVLVPLDPDPALLAVTFLGAWSIGTATSPLSAMNLSLQGAYDVPPLDFLRLNARYAVTMWLICSGAFFVYQSWH